METTSKNRGNKAKNFEILRDTGFLVPPFRVIPSEDIHIFSEHSETSEKYIEELLQNFSIESFAVRSSTSCEDGYKNSYAGQFHTELGVKPQELLTAIKKTITLSEKNLKDGEYINLIIQEYIPAEYAGVCFTRNPIGGREMVFEYHAGIGEAIVGGSTTPTTKKGYWNEKIEGLPKGCDRVIFQSIERLFGFPQDIEWCIAGEKLYILQSRSITTLSAHDYQGIEELQGLLPEIEPFQLEKTEVTEVAPRPTPFTFSLLQKIYSKNGPIDRVYQKYAIQYSDTSILKLIGNELYIDTVRESQSFFPLLGVFPFHFSSVWVSIRNFFSLTRLSLTKKSPDDFHTLMKDTMKSGREASDFLESLDIFLCEYALIFEVNLLTSFAYKKLSNLLSADAKNMVSILSLGKFLLEDNEFTIEIPTGLKGNSLEILDISETKTYNSDTVGDDAKVWWESLSDIRKKMLFEPIIEAYKWGKLREYGRILMVKNLSSLREQAIGFMGNTDISQLAFLYIDEIQDYTKYLTSIDERIKFYTYYGDFTFPHVLTSNYKEEKSDPSIQGISPGNFEGILTKESDIVSQEGAKILFTEVLSPHLTQYFDSIRGIVSTHGGMLSHLAIIAREKGMPVIIIDAKTAKNMQIGRRYVIDGTLGKYTSC